MAKDTLHVVPHGEAWAVKREGNERHSSTHDTQKTAIDSARDLAKEGDDIIIHRPDGTIRETITYTGTRNSNGAREDGNGAPKPEAHDLWSVGTRVRWAPILAGVVVAVATSALLTSFALALGITTLDDLRPRTFAVTAGIVLVFILLASLFLGGYVATRTTTRETMTEAVIFGALVWGTFFALATLGIGSGTRLGLDAYAVAQADDPNRGAERSADPAAIVSRLEQTTKLTLTPEQRANAEEAFRQESAVSRPTGATAKAWWTFAGLALSLLAAVGGALLGCGPEVTRRILRRDTTPVLPNRATELERTGA